MSAKISQAFFIYFLMFFVLAGVSAAYGQTTLPQSPSGWPQGIVQPAAPIPAPSAEEKAPSSDQPKVTKQTALEPEAVQSQVVGTPSMLTQAAAIVFISLVPYLAILLTAFIKVSVVLSLLRNALGLQQSPPNQVINGLALILSIYVMFPTGVAMYDAGKDLITSEVPKELVSAESSAFVLKFVDVTKEPLKQFLIRNTSPKHIKSFYQLAQKALPPAQEASLTNTDFLILVPSYITSQLKDAYEIGVLIYLPFFVIDLVVSNILLAMGMMMLSPLTIALPLKLLLLVMLDGWTQLIQGLVMTFK